MSLPLYDAGLQPERTLLAWRRTALAIAGGAAVGARILSEQIGAIAYLVGLAAVVVALAAYILAHRAYRRAVTEMVHGSGLAPSPGVPVAALAVACLLLSGAGIAYVLAGV